MWTVTEDELEGMAASERQAIFGMLPPGAAAGNTGAR